MKPLLCLHFFRSTTNAKKKQWIAKSYMLGQEANLLSQLPIHCLVRRLISVDPTLRELPGVLTFDALAPKHLSLGIGNYNANVRSKTRIINDAVFLCCAHKNPSTLRIGASVLTAQ